MISRYVGFEVTVSNDMVEHLLHPFTKEQLLRSRLSLIDRRNLAQARDGFRNHFDREIYIVLRGLLAQADPDAGSRSLMRQAHGQQHV